MRDYKGRFGTLSIGMTGTIYYRSRFIKFTYEGDDMCRRVTSSIWRLTIGRISIKFQPKEI